MRFMISLAFVVCLVVLAPPAAAQGPPPIPVEHLKPGDTVFVTDHQGHETSGTLVRVSSTSLAIFVHGREQEIPSNDIGRIEKPDSVWNGALVGGVLGAVLFAGGAGASCSPDCAKTVPAVGLAGGTLGALAGFRIDRMIKGRRLVYGTRPDSVGALRPTAPATQPSDSWMKVRLKVLPD